MWSEKIRTAVTAMRVTGATFREIRQIYTIPKSTLSLWCKNLPKPKHLYFEDQGLWLKTIRKRSSQVIRNKRLFKVESIAQNARKEVLSWECLQLKSTQKALLSLLYWAEGQKLPLKGSPVKFANTDPWLVLLFLTLLRNCYQLDESKLRVRLHLHWYHDVKKVREFWGQLLRIDKSRFHKVYF